LDKGLIGGAVVTGFKKDNPFEAKPFLATTKEQIMDAKSSKYCPVAMDGIIPIIKGGNFAVAIVGLPCHIHAFRKAAMNDSDLRQKIFIFIGLFCSGIKDYRVTKYVCKKCNINQENVVAFAFRDDGCLGYLKAVYKDGRVIKIPYLSVYNPMNMFFRPERCASCIDHFGLLADVSFGDIYMPPYSEDTIGTNAVVCRLKEAADLLEQSVLNGYIELNVLDASEVVRSGGIWSNRLKIFVAHKFIDKLIGREGVRYDAGNEKPSFYAIKFDIKYRLQRIIGKTFVGIFIYQWLSILYRKIKDIKLSGFA
jgi:coenzyme F420 hydrogenase subunit beta